MWNKHWLTHRTQSPAQPQVEFMSLADCQLIGGQCEEASNASIKGAFWLEVDRVCGLRGALEAGSISPRTQQSLLRFFTNCYDNCLIAVAAIGGQRT